LASMLSEKLTKSNIKTKEEFMKKGMMTLSVYFLFCLIFPLQVHAEKPLEIVKAQVNDLLDVLRDPSLKTKSKSEVKQKKIWTIVDSIFDYKELSKRSLGRNWRRLNPDQQKEFVNLFRRLLGKAYMDRIMAYADEKVVFFKETFFSENKAEVKSKLITKSNEIPMYYRLILENDSWKVYDVSIEGVSLVRNYRSQFKSILKDKAPSDLLQILRKKVG
jgi:phospholipid transport system substrate-binding protein